MESKGSTSSSNLARSLWRGFTLSYGLLVGFVWMLSALRDALFFRRRHKKVTEKELAAGSSLSIAYLPSSALNSSSAPFTASR